MTTPHWREQPTADTGSSPGAPVTRAFDHAAAAAAVGGVAAPNGWWVGSIDDPDRYELLGAGFSGGEGITYQARYHGESGEPLMVAVKLLHRPAGQASTWPAPADWARWRDQLQIIHQVRNDHLVQVRTIFVGVPPHRRGSSTQMASDALAGIPYVVMEWIPGATLDRRVAPSPGGVDPRLRITWIRHLASAISALHSVTRTAGNPLVHRDIKPANCIVTVDDRLVLIDIGTLRRASVQPDPLGMHSRHYAAPEVLGSPWAPREPASDIYSLGGVAYFCLTGADPPAAADISESSLRSALAIPRRWRRRVARHLLPLLAVDPAVRRQVRLNNWAEELQRITKRRRWPWALAGTAIAASGLALIPYIVTQPAPQPAAHRHPPTQAGQPVPAGLAASAAEMRAFGETYQRFGFAARGGTLTMNPPANFDHLWGGFLPAQDCAATVSFDVAAGRADRLPDFGIAVAPRAQLVNDQPEGASIQYEFEGADLTSRPGSYIRPAVLPGGAWSVVVRPLPAPDIDNRHHVVVYAEGTSMSIQVDGRQLAGYVLPAAECGGVAIRVWGDSFTLTNVSIRGSLPSRPDARGEHGWLPCRKGAGLLVRRQRLSGFPELQSAAPL
jgi:hypothetical protein